MGPAVYLVLFDELALQSTSEKRMPFGHETRFAHLSLNIRNVSARPTMEWLVDIMNVGFACAYRHLAGQAHHRGAVSVDGDTNWLRQSPPV